MEIQPGRYPELDGCRGLAVFLMIIFHFFVDLSFLGIPGPDPFSGPLRVFGIGIAMMFIMISGISAHIKAEKTPDFRNQVRIFLHRGAKLILIGAGITIVTWLFLKGEGYVVFGILHLIGFGLLLTPVFNRFHYLNIILAAILLILPICIDIPAGPLWMAWAGMYPVGFSSVDYTPLIPWLSPFLIGLFLGKSIYPKEKTTCYYHPLIIQWCSPFIIAGRHSLVIYLIHQPVLIFLLVILTGNIP